MADIIALRRIRRRRLRLANINRRWRLIDRQDPFSFDSSKFILNFKLTKEAVKDLCDELRPHMDASENGYSIEMQVCKIFLFIYYYYL